MISIALAMVICFFVAASLKPLEAHGHHIELVGFDGPGVVLVFVIYVASASLMGDAFAVSLLLGFALHEAGHVLANRMLGRGPSRFRMIPAFTPLNVSAAPFRKEGDAFFMAIMGAGFSLAPMAMSLALTVPMRLVWPEVADFLLVFGATIGALNFLMLLPFWPMDGGRCAEIAARNFWPALAPGLTAFMVASMGMAGMRSGSLSLLVLAAFGLHSLLRRTDHQLDPMGPNAGLIALAAYTFTFAAHFSAGWLLLDLYF